MSEKNIEGKKKGKKSFVAFLLLATGFILIALGIAMTVIPGLYPTTENESTSKEEEKDNTIESNPEVDSTGKYEGIMMYESTKNITDTFNITVPVEFVASMTESNGIERELETTSTGVFNTCQVELNEIINYNSAEKLANEMIEYHSATALTTKEINGINWYYFQYDSLGMTDTYLTEKDGHIYIFRYKIGKDADQTVCSQYSTSIINTLSYK